MPVCSVALTKYIKIATDDRNCFVQVCCYLVFYQVQKEKVKKDNKQSARRTHVVAGYVCDTHRIFTHFANMLTSWPTNKCFRRPKKPIRAARGAGH